MEPIKNLFNKVKIVRRPRQKHSTERGEPRSERDDLANQIIAMLNSNLRPQDRRWTHGRLGDHLRGVPPADWHALLSKMRDGERRGYSPGAIFWLETRGPKKKTM